MKLLIAIAFYDRRKLTIVQKRSNVKSQQQLYADGLGENGTDGDTDREMLMFNI